MDPDVDGRQTDDIAGGASRGALAAAGGLLAGGFLLNVVSTLNHPSGDEDDHEKIFAKYVDSDAWVAVHLGQFVGVLLALAGLLALYLAMRAGGRLPLVANFAAVAAVATAATWAVLQGLDGVGLKQAVDAWDGATRDEQATRFANAETVRWLEWGFQSYFRVLLGVTFALFGAGILRTGVVASWLGSVAIAAGAISAVIGVDVGYSGLASGLQDVLGLVFLVLVLAFAVGVASASRGDRRRHVVARA